MQKIDRDDSNQSFSKDLPTTTSRSLLCCINSYVAPIPTNLQMKRFAFRGFWFVFFSGTAGKVEGVISQLCALRRASVGSLKRSLQLCIAKLLKMSTRVSKRNKK